MHVAQQQRAVAQRGQQAGLVAAPPQLAAARVQARRVQRDQRLQRSAWRGPQRGWVQAERGCILTFALEVTL